MQPKAIINLKSLRCNINYIKSLINNNVNIMPVVKANAYGHGYVEITKILKKENINCVCVATIKEVKKILELNLDINILHLGKISIDMLQTYTNNNVIATINSIDDINVIDKLKIGKIKRDKKKLKIGDLIFGKNIIN